jgi:hypothetical protein
MKRRNVLQAGLSLAALPLAALPLAACTPALLPPPPSPSPPPSPPLPAAPAVTAAVSVPPAEELPSAPTVQSPKAAYERVVSRVGSNHGHVFQVTLAEVNAGVARTYDLTGTAGHAHAVTLEPDVLARLRAGEIVRVPSTRLGHLHRLLIKLAPAVDPPEAVNVCDVKIGGKDDHELIVTAADMAAKADKTYDIQGIAVHTHTVRITTADFERLARGEQLSITTSAASPGEDHGHVVFVRYPPAGARAG